MHDNQNLKEKWTVSPSYSTNFSPFSKWNLSIKTSMNLQAVKSVRSCCCFFSPPIFSCFRPVRRPSAQTDSWAHLLCTFFFSRTPEEFEISCQTFNCFLKSLFNWHGARGACVVQYIWCKRRMHTSKLYCHRFTNWSHPYVLLRDCPSCDLRLISNINTCFTDLFQVSLRTSLCSVSVLLIH